MKIYYHATPSMLKYSNKACKNVITYSPMEWTVSVHWNSHIRIRLLPLLICWHPAQQTALSIDLASQEKTRSSWAGKHCYLCSPRYTTVPSLQRASGRSRLSQRDFPLMKNSVWVSHHRRVPRAYLLYFLAKEPRMENFCTWCMFMFLDGFIVSCAFSFRRGARTRGILELWKWHHFPRP